MNALVLERKGELSIREIELEEHMDPDSVRIAVQSVGICGSDIHYYLDGRMGDFQVKKPLIPGHEASGRIVEIGSAVKSLHIGDRVCMEPGIPNHNSKISRLGRYNIDPEVKFWATPPYHGVTRPYVIHPAAFTYKLPDSVSYHEGALVEPAAIGMYAATRAKIKPGDTAVVLGAGTIGTVISLAALSAGCSQVIIADLIQEKLDIVKSMGNIRSVNITIESLEDVIEELTDGFGADIVFEASGNDKSILSVFNYICPGGKVVLVGSPAVPVPFDIMKAQVKEAEIITIFRYAHLYPKVLRQIASGNLNLKPLISKVYPFKESIEAYNFAAKLDPSTIKVIIDLSTEN